MRQQSRFGWVWLLYWFGLVWSRVKTINHLTFSQLLKWPVLSSWWKRLRKRGIIEQSKIQVTPTQDELELKLGCDNNLGLVEYGCSIGLVLLIVWFGEGKNYKSFILLSALKWPVLSSWWKWLRRRGIIMQSKIQVTPTQVEVELSFGCDNNICLVEYGCSIGLVWLIVWFGLVEGKNHKSFILLSSWWKRLKRRGIIVQSKIQVTPTQVELKLKLGCDNNSLVFYRIWPKNDSN